MICAGTGIAPFAGMIRQNRGRTIDLFFGIRHPEKDYYYRSAIDEWVGDGRLSGYFPAFSRHERRTYVQDQLRDASSLVEERLRAGARVMVCGSSRMAHAVAQEIDAIAAMLNTSVAELRQHGRYLEDVY
jgi:sulfite reductase (NADPH) flavoprotein alpha-component